MREFTLAEIIRSFAQVKTAEKSIALPGGRSSTSFDPECRAFVVTFAHNPEEVIEEGFPAMETPLGKGNGFYNQGSGIPFGPFGYVSIG